MANSCSHQIMEWPLEFCHEATQLNGPCYHFLEKDGIMG